MGLDIAVISLAKKDEEIFTTRTNFPIQLPRTNNALKLLQRVRDEAHRFAVNYHRQLRQDKGLKSELLALEGVGDKRIQELYKHFKTIEGIMTASPDDIAEIDGFGKKLSSQIWEKLHESKIKQHN